MREPTLKTENGWLSTDGKLHACGPSQHYEWAARYLWDDLGYNHDDTKNCDEYLFDLGWIKLLTWKLDKPDLEYYHKWYRRKEPTQAQIDTMFDWCLLFNEKEPKFEEA